MSFKTIIFCLFLYVCLVWVGAIYFYSGPKIEEIGLLWTGAGLGAVLAITILSRIWSWVRVLRLRTAARPKSAPKPATPAPSIPEDEAAVRALIEEATATLRRAPAYATNPAAVDLSMLPLYLLVGPEGSGKTSTFANCGLAPQLLAGEAAGPGPYLPTRLCNIWLTNNAIFVEIGGRAFTPERIPHIWRAFQNRSSVSGWRRWFRTPSRSFELRGVVAFCDVAKFSGSSTAQARERLDREARQWQEPIGALAAVSGANFPVYFLVTKCDTLPYFSDFFRRIPEKEGEQVLGCGWASTVTASDSQSEAAESKRLAKLFTTLYQALAEKRLQYLSHEPDSSKRPNIYEFPREMKRIRPAIVQFLATVFRTHPLRPNLHLSGYYFSGAGEKQVMATVASTAADWSESSGAMEASVLFRGDATQMLGRADVSLLSKSAAAAGTTRRWLFVTELFEDVVLRNARRPMAAVPDRSLNGKKAILCAVICAVCLLLCFAFATSWTRNLDLLDDVSHNANLHKDGDAPTLADLQSLENLRTEVAQLSRYERANPPLSLRWGLYAGNRVLTPARDLYFRRFAELLLNPLHSIITKHLESLPTVPANDAPYSPVFKLLAAHLMIAGSCKPDSVAVSEVLKETGQQIAPSSYASAWQTLANTQIEFYAQELAYQNPVQLRADNAARDRARQYLSQIRGADRIYARVLADAESAIIKPQQLRSLSPDYTTVLTGPNEISPVFSKEGWTYIEKASKGNNASDSKEACVLGHSRRMGFSESADAQTEQAVEKLFIADYAEHWRKYLQAFSVKRYGGTADAAQKLDVLSDHKSPLLALLAMVSNQTDFPMHNADPQVVDRAKSLVNKLIPTLGTAAAKVPADRGRAVQPADTLSRLSDITRYFQPVHVVVTPSSDTWVTEKNNAYMQALQQLGHAMQDLARSPSADPALTQAASQSRDKAIDAAKQLALGFEPLGVGGLDVTVERLLEAPIRGTDPYIIDPTNAIAGKVNAQLRSLCVVANSTLQKYPFHPSQQDSSMADVAALFAPGNGAIWKFQTDSLGEFAIKEGLAWKAKDPSKKPQITQEMLSFLNRAEAVTDAFYPPGSSQPRFSYTLRPKLDAAYRDAVLELEIDGQVNAWTSSLQKQFTWPSTGSAKTGVVGRIKMGSVAFPFASRGGPWAIFRVMNDAEPRPLGSKAVEWKYLRGGDGRTEEIIPAPVRLEFVEFPAGVDLFNPKFFEGLQCPSHAVQP